MKNLDSITAINNLIYSHNTVEILTKDVQFTTSRKKKKEIKTKVLLAYPHF